MLRIVSVVVLVAVVAGCGGAAQPQRSAARGVPRALALEWEGQASAIASAASAGNKCRAMHLAAALRDEVSASQDKVPPRLRTPLLTGVNALANRISTCTRVVVTTVQTPPAKGPPPHPKPKPKPPHGPPGHKHGGDGNDQ